MKTESKIFSRNRTLGQVTNEVPLAVRYIQRRRESLIVTVVGKYFFTWNSSRFTLLSVSPQLEEPIHCLAADTFLIFTASGSEVQAWRRGVEIQHTYKCTVPSVVHLMLPFGPHLIGIDEANVLTIWDIKSTDIYLEIQLPKESFKVTTICHPPTYLNKVLLGSEQGELRLYNILTSQLIYSFKSWGSEVTALTPSFALDVVGVGLNDGRIILHNLKTDETILTFRQDWGSVTNLSFRSDGNNILASGTTRGHIVFWDLEERKLITQNFNAHNGKITGMQYLPSEGLMVTSSPDNALKMWVFDNLDGGSRLLRIRDGHARPPTMIRFYGTNGEHVLTASSDGHLRALNTTTEIANKNFGKAVPTVNGNRITLRNWRDDVASNVSDYTRKIPPIEQFAFQLVREKDWDNIAAIHAGTPIISTWSFSKVKFGSTIVSKQYSKFAKSMGSFYDAKATSVFITHCGNYVVVGYKFGQVEKYNMESSLYRGSYCVEELGKAHKGAVTGVICNNINRILVTGSTDGFIKFWNFKISKKVEKDCRFKLNVEEPILFMRNNTDSSVIGVVLENYSILIVDIDYRTIIRKFVGHRAPITDCTFNPDGRWLVSAAMDSTIRTWDLPAGKEIDAFVVDKPCVSLTFCPTSMYLATAHVDELGVTLWYNKTIFSLVTLNTYDICSLRISDDDDYDTLGEISKKNALVTLTADSEKCPVMNRWQTLLQIDQIRERNKAKKVIKEREDAPFILPEIPGIDVRFDVSALTNEIDNGTKDRFIIAKKFENLSIFAKLLVNANTNEDYDKCVQKLLSFGPSIVNFEIASLSPESGGSIELMSQFLKMLNIMLESRKNFELTSSYLALFLKNYADFVVGNQDLHEKLTSVSNLHKEIWTNLQNRFAYCISTAKFLKDN